MDLDDDELEATRKLHGVSKEIEVGEYVRTPNDGIFIISHINVPFEDDNKNKVCLCQNSKVAFISINAIKQLKHSKDILDLIEEGDYVNGHKVLKVEDDGFLLVEDKGYAHLAPINFKTIVTKEQFAQKEYRIKE